jgi:hypothetical protein
MHKNATKCNKTLSKWCKNKHGASKIIDTFKTYQAAANGLHGVAIMVAAHMQVICSTRSTVVMGGATYLINDENT